MCPASNAAVAASSIAADLVPPSDIVVTDSLLVRLLRLRPLLAAAPDKNEQATKVAPGVHGLRDV
jgi:hypothetical protein